MSNTTLPVEFMLLRDISDTSGVVHDAQIINLKMWAYLAFPDLSWHEMEIRDKTVKYSLYLSPEADISARKSGGGEGMLLKNIQFLLGDTWKVKIIWKKSGKRKKNVRRNGAK